MEWRARSPVGLETNERLSYEAPNQAASSGHSPAKLNHQDFYFCCLRLLVLRFALGFNKLSG